MKYRKKPIIVDAFKWTDDPDGKQEPSWLIEALKKPSREVGAVCVTENNEYPFLEITTEGGYLTVEKGDYIILNAEGEIVRMPPKIFEATYEKVEE